jgi:hypothetical protein
MPFPLLAAGAKVMIAGAAASSMSGTKSNTQTIVNDIVSKVLNESINEVTDKIIIEKEIKVNSESIVEINNTGIMKCGTKGLKITSSAKSTIQNLTTAYKESEKELVNELQTAMSQKIKLQAVQKNQSDWTDVFKRNQENVLDIMNKQELITEQIIKNAIEDNIEIKTDIDNKTISKIIFNNTGIIEGDGCEFTSESFVEVIAEDIAEKISNTEVMNKLTQDLTVSIDTETSQSNTAASIWPLIIGAIIFLMVIGGIGFFMLGDEGEYEGDIEIVDGGFNKFFKGGNPFRRGIKSIRNKGKSAIFNILLLMFMLGFTISFIVYIVKLWNSIGFCDDETEIPLGLIPGGNTAEDKDKCWDGLKADPAKVEMVPDRGGLCDFNKETFNDYMNEQTELEGDNWNLDDFKPPWQKCDNKKFPCAFCRNEKPLSKSFGLILKNTWKWGSTIAMYVFIILLIFTLIAKSMF